MRSTVYRKEIEEPVTKTPRWASMKNEEMLAEAFEVFRNKYENRIRKTTIQDIVKGEVIKTHPDNIFIDEPSRVELANLEKQLQFCNKKLYGYQINAIKKIRELETYNEIEREKYNIKSNGWLLNLPIGSGKSLVFLFLSIFYPTVPANPIIISTSGYNIPSHEMVQFKYYPFYYENVGYTINKDDDYVSENCSVVMEDYNQRKMTVIITHHHLLSQLEDYIRSDFSKSLMRQFKICYATNSSQIKLDSHILIVSCSKDIMQTLVKLSYEAPFARVIVDDYTNMSGVDEFRQILASSTLFVSGSGFERDLDKFPPSYYTLKHIDVPKFSLVAKPEETREGVMRNSIMTADLIGANTEFSTYAFTNQLDELSFNRYRFYPGDLDLNVLERSTLQDYLKYAFLYHNANRLSRSIANIEKDRKTGKLNDSRIKYYLQWKEYMNKNNEAFKEEHKNDPEYKSQAVNQPVMQRGNQRIVRPAVQKGNQRGVKTKELVSPLYNDLFKEQIVSSQNINSIVMHKCCVCDASTDLHVGWGFIASCCGSFFCANCIDAATTNTFTLDRDSTGESDEIKTYTDKCNYYCCTCHAANPKFIVNTTRNKKNNLQPYTLISTNFDVKDIDDAKGIKTDYYFKMLIEGLTPLMHDGKTIVVDSNGDFDGVEDANYAALIPKLYAKDSLAMSIFNCINDSLKQLEINPRETCTVLPTIMIYDCPQHMESKVKDYFQVFSDDVNSPLCGIKLTFIKDMSSVIGLHKNVLAIVAWNEPANTDENKQLIGRILRLNAWGNPLYFYLTCRSV
jgi:hypothetical protein